MVETEKLEGAEYMEGMEAMAGPTAEEAAAHLAEQTAIRPAKVETAGPMAEAVVQELRNQRASERPGQEVFTAVMAVDCYQTERQAPHSAVQF